MVEPSQSCFLLRVPLPAYQTNRPPLMGVPAVERRRKRVNGDLYVPWQGETGARGADELFEVTIGQERANAGPRVGSQPKRLLPAFDAARAAFIPEIRQGATPGPSTPEPAKNKPSTGLLVR